MLQTLYAKLISLSFPVPSLLDVSTFKYFDFELKINFLLKIKNYVKITFLSIKRIQFYKINTIQLISVSISYHDITSRI